jgi:hypothetical protein
MTVTATRGYLYYPYESMPYLIGEIDDSTGMQVKRVIASTDDDAFIGMQINRFIDSPGDDSFVGLQVLRVLSDELDHTGFQVNRQIIDDTDDPATGMQVNRESGDNLIEHGMQVIRAFPMIVGHPNYLAGPYLMGPYLTAQNCSLLGMEINRVIVSAADDVFTGIQINRQIVSAADDPKTGMQTQRKINIEIPKGMQITRIKISRTPMQINKVLYNVEQLRILCDFVSRGTPALGGINWTSPQGVAAGDFSLNNLNTDIIEQRTQSPNAVLNWDLRCDSGQLNSFVDTIAILGHNITSGATVTFQGSDDPGYGTIKFNRTIKIEPNNSYFVLPLSDFPSPPARYFRFLISDTSNPDNHIKIGTIIFGSSIVFSKQTTFDLPLSFGKTHFKDTIQTEGFTSVSNDRAMRKSLGLNFSSIDYGTGDYNRLADYFDSAKTDLKCLVIPYPCKPSLFAVFAKLSRLPLEQHNAIELCGLKEVHTVDLQLEWDESL